MLVYGMVPTEKDLYLSSTLQTMTVISCHAWILINKLELPYTDVKVVLDDLNDYDRDLYALGKVYAYGIQEEPFIHVDADIYMGPVW